MTNSPWPHSDVRVSTADQRYVLRLYVTGTTSRSARAVVNVRRICDEFLNGKYDLEVIDILRSPEKAVEGQILAAPTLVKLSPHPVRRLIGDMSKTDRLLSGLGLTDTNSLK
jgi:circadian clock protein KaiB